MIRAGVTGLLLVRFAFGQGTDAILSGWITDSVTHQPIAGATVSYRFPTADSSTVSDAAGKYSIPISLGKLPWTPQGISVLIAVSKPGYATLGGGITRVIVPIKQGGSETRDFELGRAGNFAGRLLDRDTHQPVEGFSVTAWRNDGEPGRFDAKASGADGSFAIADLDPASYILEVDPPRGKILTGERKPDEPAYGPTWFPGVPRYDMAAPILLSSGETRTIELPMQKRKLRHIAGSVQVPESFASDGIQLDLLEQTGARTHVYGELAHPGSFHIEGLEPGSYMVRAETKTKSPRDRAYAVAALEINERDIDDLKMEVRAGVTLHTVIRMAEEGVKVPSRVFITPLSVDGWMIDPDARRSEGLLVGVPPGEYLPVLNGIGVRGYALASMVYGGRVVPAGPVDVEAADSTITLILTSKPGRISGFVRKGDQSPAPDSTIVLLPASTVDALGSIDLTNRGGRVKVGQILAFKPGEMMAASDTGGNFVFEDLAPGSYNAIVFTGGDRARFADPVFLRDRLRSAATVVIEAGATANLEMRIPE